MPPYLRLGSIPRKRHIAHPPASRLQGRRDLLRRSRHARPGFGRAYSIVYHLRPPTRVTQDRAGRRRRRWRSATQPVLRHHHLKTRHDAAARATRSRGRVPLLANDDVILCALPARPSRRPSCIRNAAADEVIFVHQGQRHAAHACSARCRSSRSTTSSSRAARPIGSSSTPAVQPDLLVIESAGNVDDPAALPEPRRPAPARRSLQRARPARPDARPLVDRPRRGDDGAHQGRPPADALHAGAAIRSTWSAGTAWSTRITFNADDFEPITGTIHQPPPVHQTFEAPGFVVCTFAPRMLDTHPEAIKVPYAHSNVQADEVLYYVRGQFGSRRGVEEASFTLHPRGIPHGPHPGTIVASRDVTRTDELAVMVDTFRPLQLTRQAMELDDPSYPLSWID